MKVLIHAYPKRMWYVEGWLVPELERFFRTKQERRESKLAKKE